MKCCLFFIIIPLVAANVLHMVVVKRNWLAGWTIPVSTSLFGANKTLRGFVIVPVLTGFFEVVANFFIPWFSIGIALLNGCILGLAYVLSELPNSWIKRRAGVAPGENSGKYKVLFRLMDKTDSALGVSIAAFFLFDLQVKEAFIFFIAASTIHAVISWILVVVGVKRSF